MNLFDQYGIKEVADVTIYSIHKKEDGSGDIYYVPALYLDTLKVATTEKTAENTWAQGGLGNNRLIGWDHSKTINLTLEDALCTPASLGLCWGGILGSDWKDGQIKHTYGIKDASNCGTERISRMEKAFYPRNDTVNATISNLLPRDGAEDILPDQNGDPIYLSRSSVLDGTDVRGFGYVNGHPYKWRLEIESDIKSVVVVPDRFFSTYGKSYPIKRKQTVGINQPSESFKYEIIYKRGYDSYDNEGPIASIIYHKQAEENLPKEYTCNEDRDALRMLDDFTNYPFLKLRVCYDNSVKAYLGQKDVYWDWEMTEVEEAWADPDTYKRYWVEIPQIDTSQFENIDLWLRFDSINALSYYILTKYEENIYAIGPKKIYEGLANSGKYQFKLGNWWSSQSLKTTYPENLTILLRGINYDYQIKDSISEEWGETQTMTVGDGVIARFKPIVVNFTGPDKVGITDRFQSTEIQAQSDAVAWIKLLLDPPTGVTGGTLSYDQQTTELEHAWYESDDGTFRYDLNSIDITKSWDIFVETRYGNRIVSEIMLPRTQALSVDEVAGKNYDLIDPIWTKDAECTPCCKKDNLSRSIWAYVNPKNMMPYDDDYWFHQGEPYYKKSLTLSTKERPLKAQRIFVEAGVFPGMYKIVGETYIRSRDTGEDERVQLSFPLCKIKSNQTLTLSADGDPTTFNLEVEVATPQNGIPMEITFYEVEKDQKVGCCGNLVEKDGSTKISAK